MGRSMLPSLKPQQLLVIRPLRHHPHIGDVILVVHNGVEKVKRVSAIDSSKGVFVLGDNAGQSTDSRSFGWVDFDEITAKVVWPRSNRPV